jgi:aspartyl-tRNA(Asn)/glutamyl-tRNA(Gln) amidotransferase subunit C
MPNIEFNVDDIAKLAMLDLSDEERVQFCEQLPSIMAYISKLHEVDTLSVESSAYISDLKNVVRDDMVSKLDNDVRSGIIKSFPEEKGGALSVPAVFE